VCGKAIDDPRGYKYQVCSQECQKVVVNKQNQEKYSAVFTKRKNNQEYALSSFGVPKRYLLCSFESYIPKTSSQAKALKVISSITSLNSSMFLSGRPGVGKTHLAISLIRKLMLTWGYTVQDDAGYSPQCGISVPIEFFSANNILLKIKRVFSTNDGSEEKEINKYASSNFLVIDDIGTDKATDWALGVWYTIIDARYCKCIPTIITSNYSLSEFASKYGDRLASRLSSGIIINIEGEDYRVGAK